MPLIEVRVAPPAKDCALGHRDLSVVGIVDVYSVPVEDGDVISIGVLARAKEGMLADTRGDMKFIGGGSHGEWVLCDFGCGNDIAAG